MKQKVSSLVIKIEEFINNRYYPVQSQDIFIKKNKKSDARVSKLDDNQKKKIDEYLNEIKKPQTQPDFVCDIMPSKGFVYEDGQLNFVKFYTYARISPDVWHTFITKKHKASEDTMFKIIFALKLTEDEAEIFLGLGGIAFNPSNDTHKYILACINTKIYDPDEVYEVLEFYKVHNIYAEKKPRNNCK